jgi:hypothetical protein
MALWNSKAAPRGLLGSGKKHSPRVGKKPPCVLRTQKKNLALAWNLRALTHPWLLNSITLRILPTAVKPRAPHQTERDRKTRHLQIRSIYRPQVDVRMAVRLCGHSAQFPRNIALYASCNMSEISRTGVNLFTMQRCAG